jgi:tRNA threonylcarbamoyl adenosine modification protein (Sua5/YciO/YrdC/YwlC family)
VSASAEQFERCMAAGGLAVFPADTVYGLACDPANRVAVERLYLLKQRPLSKPSAVMFFDLELALEALPELGEMTVAALRRLLPGGVSVLLPNPAERFPLACGEDSGTLGLRVPVVETLAGVRWPVLQSSANRAGGPDPRRLSDVPTLLREAADLLIDEGELPGTPSTVVDLRSYEETGEWSVVREGAVPAAELKAALRWQFHFDPATYPGMIRSEVPEFDALQDAVVAASGTGAERILELGTGTGETARRLLAAHPSAALVGIDASARMLAAARAELPGERVSLVVGRLEEPLPEGQFDLVASALCVHHLNGPEKAWLFARVREALVPGGRFVLGDVVVPEDPTVPLSPQTPGFDQPSRVDEQLGWLAQAGFEARLVWSARDLAVIAATRAGIVAEA